MKSRYCAAVGFALAGTLLLAGALQAQTGNVAPDKTVATAKTPPGTKAKAAPAASAAAADPKSQASYSLGLSIGTQLHGYGMSAGSVTAERVLQGLRDALAGKKVAGVEDSQRVQALISQARTEVGSSNQAAAAKFLAENGKLPGIITTASGLQYKVLQPGAGASPKLTDDATVNYRGTLLDGTEFDSSYKRNQPATFTVGRVIKGWVEALQLMKPGAKFQLFIPPDLAYGMEPPQGPIPPGALLKFDVELISVKPAAAATSGSAPKF